MGLFMCYGFAVSDNPCDTVAIALKPAGANETTAPPALNLLKLTPAGVPEELVDEIEAEQDTEKFVALLQAVLVRRRAARESLAKLPQALNFTVCKGPLNRGRKRSIEHFLEGELQILDKCMEEMEQAENAYNAGGNAAESAHSSDEDKEGEDLAEAEEDDGSGIDSDEALEMIGGPKKKKQRRR